MIETDQLTSIEIYLSLPRGILAAIIAQESGGNAFAIRYEPGFFTKYIDGKPLIGSRLPGASEDTERRARATSWGLMQIMGESARELGFDRPFLSELCDPIVGVRYGAKLLRRKLDIYTDLARALSAYNAGSPTDSNLETYVRPVLAYLNDHA